MLKALATVVKNVEREDFATPSAMLVEGRGKEVVWVLFSRRGLMLFCLRPVTTNAALMMENEVVRLKTITVLLCGTTFHILAQD